MTTSNFRDWTLDKIDEAFDTVFVGKLPILDKLLVYKYTITDVEKDFLERIRDY